MSKNCWHPHELNNLRGLGDRWDDLRFPATAINPPGQASDPDVDPTSGMLLFDPNSTELVFAIAQMPHAWKEGSEIHPHVHWCKSTSAVGDVAWRLRYRLVGVGEIGGGWVDLGIVSTTTLTDPNTAFFHNITAFSAIDMTGQVLSTIINFELSRVGTDASDTYGADARMAEFDVHYQIDSRGSRQEFIK